MKASRVTRLTIISTAAGLCLRGISLALNVFLTNRMGAEGIGLFTVIMSVYGLGVSFSSAGYRLAATRLAVEDEASEKPDARALIAKMLVCALVTGTAAALVLYCCSETVGVKMLSQSACVPALKVLSLTLPLISLEAVLTAYLGAFYKVIKTAAVQAAAQITQTVYIIATFRQGADMEYCCLQIAKGSVVGELCALITAAILVAAELSGKKRIKSKKPFFKDFLRIAVPDALGYDLRSGLSTIQHLLIPAGLKKFSKGRESGLALYGVMHGMALQVVLFPSCILRSLASILVPAVTESRTRGDVIGTKAAVRRVIHMTQVFSVGCAGVMFFCSDNIASTLYHSLQSAGFIRLFSPLIPVMYLDISVDSMLKGLDCQVASMGYNLLDSFVSVILVYFLLPVYGVSGYIVMVFVTELMNTSMSLYKLVKVSGVNFSVVSDILLPVLCAIGAGSIGTLSARAFSYGAPSLVLQIVITVLSYTVLSVIMCSETKENILHMAGIKQKLAA